MAVPLLIVIALVLAWGTIYETRFGTAAVQRFIYHSWWFQGLLAFLALNLAVAALERYPWKRRHLPFVCAHIGIILILIGGIIGARFGVEGQLIIPEGEAEKVLQLPGNVLAVRLPNPGVSRAFPTNFETQAWVREPHVTFPVTVEGRSIQLTVDRYYPDARLEEEITEEGSEENPAIQLQLQQGEHRDTFWLLARDPERFGLGWGEAHVLFLEPGSAEQLERLLSPPVVESHPRGVVSLRFAQPARSIEIPVPSERHRTLDIDSTPYRITFKDYFPDFAITEEGITSRSSRPNNPAVSFVLSGPEGDDAYLLFALHPEIPTLHGWNHRIRVEAAYRHPSGGTLPPNAIVFLREPSGSLAAVLVGPSGERELIRPLEVGQTYAHPRLSTSFEVKVYYPRARLVQHVVNRGEEVRAEFLHLIAREGAETAEGWVGLRGSVELAIGKEPVQVEYRPAQRELPFTIKLLDFRKIAYPGIEMAAGFESDIQLSDPQRGLILMRQIRMNHPLRYRGYSFYQSSFIPGEVETTILSVRSDPGTPIVYAGFAIVILGVVAMFILRGSPADKSETAMRKSP